jgi:hypothetical protein
MKRSFGLAAVATAALVAAGIAVAHGIDARNARAVAGTFTATTASRVETKTCTTEDGKTLSIASGTYTGTSAGDADLAGALTIHAKSVLNTTDNVGVVSGSLRIDVASGPDTRATFETVYGAGALAGLAVGRAHDPSARLVANLSAGFTSSGGFTSGKLGGGTAGGAAIELGPGHCRPASVVREHSEAKGTVSAVSSTSITVAGLTCAVPASLQSKLNGVSVGSRAEIRCQLVNGTNTLTRISRKG